LVFLLVVTAVFPVFAQTISLTVVVTDEQGARIPDLPITISLDLGEHKSGENTETAFVVSGKTDASGEFRTELPGPGVYDVYVTPHVYVVNLTQSAKSEETFAPC